MKIYDVIVIGGGPAGITIAKMCGKTMSVAVIRPEDYSMIYCAMPYAIEGHIDREKTLKKDSLVTDAGADLMRNTVREIDFSKKILHFTDSKSIGYRKLVIATGADPFIPGIEGINLEGVTGFKTERDMDRIETLITSGAKHAVVVGAGAIGIELAQALNTRGLRVELVDMAESILPNMTDPEISEPAQEELIRSGIHLHLKTKVTGLKGTDIIERVIMDNGDIIHFDDLESECLEKPAAVKGFVVFATGMRPNISLVEDSGMEIGPDGIVVNERMETSLPDVYAAGDCVQFHSGITGTVIAGKLATNAVPMARVLAFNLLGQDRTYPGFYNGAATKAGTFFIGGTGLTETAAARAGFDIIKSYSELTSKFPMMPGANRIHLKLVADRKTGQLLGGQIIGKEPVTDKVDLLTLAIQNELPFESLTSLSYSAQPYQSFFPAANLFVQAADALRKQL